MRPRPPAEHRPHPTNEDPQFCETSTLPLAFRGLTFDVIDICLGLKVHLRPGHDRDRQKDR